MQIFKESKTKGAYNLMVQELRISDSEHFFKFFRMSTTRYEHILSLIAPSITKCALRRETVGASERLSVTLRYLFGGASHIDLAGMFRISPSCIGRIINETCVAIWNVLLEQNYIRYPQNEAEWKAVAAGRKWNFPHCIGAMDGKHIVMQAPARSGSYFFNYKKSHSIVLLAVCNANYEFILIDIGDTGRNSDGGVFANSDIGVAMEENLLNIPGPEEIQNSGVHFPYVLVGDEAFPLKSNLLKPYPREVLARKSVQLLFISRSEHNRK